MHWSSDYIGIPFLECGRDRDGIDCWGLVRMVLQDRFNVDLPSYSGGYVTASELKEISRLLSDGFAEADWRETEEPNEFDVALFRHASLPAHIGVVLKPGLMLHSYNGRLSGVEGYMGPHWKPRLLGFYRHACIV